MVDLTPGSVVEVVNPTAVVKVSQPGLVKSLVLMEGTPGTPGRAVNSIARTSGTGAAGTTDTYTITYSDATTTTFSIYNGTNGTNGSNGTNGTNGTNGRAVTSIARTSGTGAAGTTDTYTITYSDATTSTFNVVNGANGSTGATGAGVPTGGTTGQVLKKNSATNYDTSWLSLGTAATVDTGTTSGTVPVLGASGTLAVARLATGAPDGTKFVRDDGTLATPAGASTGLLGRTEYAPGTQTTKSTTSTTIADADPTNLAVTFTAPASGQVDVTLEGFATNSAATHLYNWGLRVNTTDLLVSRAVVQGINTGTRVRTTMRVTGLTGGASVTLKWAHRVSNAATTGGLVIGAVGGTGSNAGPATMEVAAA